MEKDLSHGAVTFATFLITAILALVIHTAIVTRQQDFFALVEIETAQSHRYIATYTETKHLRNAPSVTCEGVDGNDTYVVIFYGKKSSAGDGFPFHIRLGGAESHSPSLSGDMPDPSYLHKVRSVSMVVEKPTSYRATLTTFLNQKDMDAIYWQHALSYKERASSMSCGTMP